jgi:hypothetical protein
LSHARKIEQAFSALDCVEVNKDFSRAGGIYCYKDGERTELQMMVIRFITSKLLRVIVCAAAGLYGLYNAISCLVTLYKAGHQPYLMAGAVRFDFQGLLHDGRHARWYLPAFWGCWCGSSSRERKNCGKRPQSGEFADFL